MSPGHWEILIVCGILFLFFGPYIVRLVRLMTKSRGEGEERDENARIGRGRRGKLASTCPHCGAKLPENAEFCPQCGHRVGVIDI